MKISTQRIGRNVVLSMLAQIISLLTSFVLGFIVPKFIDEYQYSYWQTFLLYINYVTLLQFGVLDGIVLRYAQYDYDELEKPRLRSQLHLLLVALTLVAGALCVGAGLFLDGATKWIVILVAGGILTKNLFTYTSYTFQITNRIHLYATIVIAQRAVYALMIVALLLAKSNDFYWYCIADLVGDLFGIVLGVVFTRDLYIGKPLPIRACFREAKENISSGFFLTFASFVGGFLIVGSKTVIQWHWDTLVFGKLAFSFSVSMALVSFVNAIGVVLFPSLKRMNEEDLPDLYGKMRSIFTVFIFIILLCYFPGCWILARWLPKYTESLSYLGILLAMILFYTRLAFLTNNYLKAYRKEKQMFIVNVVTVMMGMGMFLLCAYVFNNLELLLYSVVFSITIRSVASELIVERVIQKKYIKECILEALMTAGFIFSVRWPSSLWVGCAIYGGLVTVYCIINRKSVGTMLYAMRNLLQKEENDI